MFAMYLAILLMKLLFANIYINVKAACNTLAVFSS